MTKKRGAITCAVGAIIAVVLSFNDPQLKVSRAGLELIGNYEACRRDPYKCPADVWTDGIGNTVNVKPGTVKNDEQIARDWMKNIFRAQRCIDRNFRGEDMSQGAYDGMVSAAFNMGCPNLMFYTDDTGKRVRTTIWRNAQAGNFPGMCRRLPDFVRAAGRVLTGLQLRRNAEMRVCLGGA